MVISISFYMCAHCHVDLHEPGMWYGNY